MNVAVAKTTTGATLDGTFAAARGRLPGTGPVTETRQRAFDAFAVNGLPNRRVEEWKYTDLRKLLGDVAPLAAVPAHERVHDDVEREGAHEGQVEAQQVLARVGGPQRTPRPRVAQVAERCSRAGENRRYLQCGARHALCWPVRSRAAPR